MGGAEESGNVHPTAWTPLLTHTRPLLVVIRRFLSGSGMLSWDMASRFRNKNSLWVLVFMCPGAAPGLSCSLAPWLPHFRGAGWQCHTFSLTSSVTPQTLSCKPSYQMLGLILSAAPAALRLSGSGYNQHCRQKEKRKREGVFLENIPWCGNLRPHRASSGLQP